MLRILPQSLRASSLPEGALLVQLILQPEIIRDHRDELRIRGLSAIILNGVPKVAVESIHIASVPRDLDRVANGTLHAGCGGLKK